ncbi:MAG: aliphatic sulfonate ABC transporter substrate-binding protein [Acidimicrobiia bacterium]|nr:aliphatic sulfonate ABC transporter substrate-binding protein [Acidimicrobiia bacterium]MDH4363689.1 aliphatic sulfonate ABC transporter substrate-binding protein [Acidimicrobiia bacterium]MDH5291491.1 aliphatic sulfonate ABC transporter substrate-binding protein [Acidimicrobiia bacterium]
MARSRSVPAPRAVRLLAVAAALGLATAACGSSDDTAADTAASGGSGTATSEATGSSAAEGTATGSSAAEGTAAGEPITIGYSAWPGWFPLAVAEKEGLFEQAGVNVKLQFFADYLGSLDAMSAGQLDGNTQTLNDTMFAVAAGDQQVIVVTNDNSAGNDAIICDASVGDSIEDLKGKTIAAEPGVVDHFLLLQGLASVGLAESDIDFRGVTTDAAAAAFAGGEFDCVGVFAPFTVQALERPGSKVVFDSADFPGTISDHIVVTPELIEERPQDVQKLVDAWYLTLDWIEANPDEALATLADVAELTPEEYESLADGTKIFDASEALTTFTDSSGPTSLERVAKLINPFLVESGLTEKEAPLDGLFDGSFTQANADGAA